jgi:hypothetical protein
MLGRMLGVFRGMDVMSVCQVRVVGSSYVVTVLMMPCGFAVMTRSLLMVFRCLLVMMRCFLGHGEIPLHSLLCSAHFGIMRTLTRSRSYRGTNERWISVNAGIPGAQG